MLIFAHKLSYSETKDMKHYRSSYSNVSILD